jgi:anti-sigma-K factor RskA
MEQELVHEQVAAYALDALDDDERETFERHLATCEQCRADIGGFREAAALMAVDADPVDPPPELRGRILEAARAERPNVVPLRRRTTARPLVWFATAAAAAAVVLAVWGGIKTHDLSNERSARQADRQALAVLADPNAQLTALKGGNGTLAVAPDGSAVLAVSSLSPAPSGKTYEAWVIKGSKPARAGLLRGGDGTSTLVLGQPVPKGAVVAVTVERSGGVDAPTTTPIITASRTA